MPLAGTIISLIGLLLTAAVSGPIRTITGLPIDSALAAAFLGLYTCGVYIFHGSRSRGIDPAGRSPAAFATVFAVITSSAAAVIYYHIPYRGLVSVGGGDAGNHVHYIKRFINDAPDINQGFSSFYSTVYWLEVFFSLNSFQAFRAAFYLEIAALCLLFSFIAGRQFQTAGLSRSFRQQCLGWGVLLILISVPAQRIILPAIHYLQADGFYPQLFGLIPLLSFWVIYAVFPARTYRWAGLCLVIVWYRYSYGLNLGDLLITFSILVFWDKIKSFTLCLQDLTAVLAATAAAAAAAYCYNQLLVILPIPGAAAQINIAAAAVGLLLLAASFFLALGKINTDDSLFRFPAVFSLTAAVVPLLLLFHSESRTYYLYKYSFHGVIFAVLANVLLCSVVICGIVIRPNRGEPVGKFRAGAVLAFSFCGLWLLNGAYRTLMPSYLDRKSDALSSELIFPLTDEGARQEIESVLEQSDRQFGGLITPSWPISNFLNASFGYYGALGLYRHGKIRSEPGHCVFFHNGPESLERYRRQKLERVLAQISILSASPALESKQYKNLETGKDEILSHICYSNST